MKKIFIILCIIIGVLLTIPIIVYGFSENEENVILDIIDEQTNLKQEKNFYQFIQKKVGIYDIKVHAHLKPNGDQGIIIYLEKSSVDYNLSKTIKIFDEEEMIENKWVELKNLNIGYETN